MPFERIEVTDRGASAVGVLPSGRTASIRVVRQGNGFGFVAEVNPLEGCDDERAAEIELRRVMGEAEAVERRLSERFGTPCGGPEEDLLLGAASWLEGSELGPEALAAGSVAPSP